MIDGVAEVEGLPLAAIPSREEYRTDLVDLWKMVKDPAVKGLCMVRLQRLSMLWEGYALNHAKYESDDSAQLVGDMYSVMKVDNHIHLAAAMTPNMFLKFIRKKLVDEPNRVVAKGQTLRQVLQSAVDQLPKPKGVDIMNLGTEALGELIHADSLRMCAGEHFYHRFDNFNAAYCPLGSDALRTVFMKTSNEIDGEYFGQLTP